jgi:hypothetical protein
MAPVFITGSLSPMLFFAKGKLGCPAALPTARPERRRAARPHECPGRASGVFSPLTITSDLFYQTSFLRPH